MSLYSTINNGLNVLENKRQEFYDNTHEYSSLRDFLKGLGGKTNIIELKNDKKNTIIVSCKKDTKVDDYYLNRLGLVSIERHNKESLCIEFKNDVANLVDQCNKLPNFDKSYKLSKSGDDILRALGGWSNLYSVDITGENIFASIEDMALLDEGILQGYGATDIIIFDQHRTRINMGEISQYLDEHVRTAVMKDFFRTACKYIQALGGHNNIGRMKGDVTQITVPIDNIDLVNVEDLNALKPVKVSHDDRSYILYLGQCTDIFAKVLKNITPEDVEKTLTSNKVHTEETTVDISILDPKQTHKDKNSYSIMAPITGKVVRLNSVNDEVFSENVLGDGVAIEPTGDTLYAPFDGVVSLSAKMKHALHVKSNCGITLLLHVGLNTIHSDSECFEVKVHNQQAVKQGDPLIKFALQKLQDNNIDTIVPIVVSQSNHTHVKDVNYNTKVTASEDVLFTLR